MRLKAARVAAVADAELTAEQTEALAPMRAGPIINIYRTLVQAPKALTRFIGWGGYVLSRRNDLPARERELVILRTAFLCGSGYEWAQHVQLALQCGVTSDEIERVKQSARAGWSDADAALLGASDELHNDQFIRDATWTALGLHFTDKQCMDLVFTVGQYTQVSMILNSFGVQLDEGFALDPDLDRTAA